MSVVVACLRPARVQGGIRLGLMGRKKAPAEPVEGGREKKVKKYTQKHNRRTTISEQRAAGPSLLPLHKSQHDVYTTKLSLRCRPLSKYLGTDSVCVCVCAVVFFSFCLGTARHRRAEHNDIFRDRPRLSKTQCVRQMSWPAIT